MRSYDFAKGKDITVSEASSASMWANLDLAGQENDVSERLPDFSPRTQAGIRVFVSDRVSLGCYAKYVHLISPFSDVMNGFSGMHVPVKSGTSTGIEAGVRFSMKRTVTTCIAGPSGIPLKLLP